MSAVENLCNHAFILDRSKIVLYGNTHEIITSYLSNGYPQNWNPFSDCPRTGNGKLRVKSFHLETPEGEVLPVAKSGAPVTFVFEFENIRCDFKDRVSFSFSVHTDREYGLFHYYSHFSDVYFKNIPARGYFKCLVPETPLAPGNYLIMCRVMINGDQFTGEEADWPRVFVPITVVGGDFYSTGNANLSTWGPILVKSIWSLGRVPE